MNRLLRHLGLILALAALWAIGGCCIGTALEIIGFNTYRLSTILASLNVILGMIVFLYVTKDAAADRMFFEAGLPIRPTHPTIGCLWVIPIMLIMVGISMWLWALLLNWFFPK